MRDILKDALLTLKSSWFAFYMLPGMVAVGVFFYQWFYKTDFNLYDGIIETIGIFAAFMFTLIFVIVEHFIKRKETRKSQNEEDKNYIAKYRQFARDAVAMISFSILLAGGIILFQIIIPNIEIKCAFANYIANSIMAFFLFQYLILILLIIREMYAMLTDDIES